MWFTKEADGIRGYFVAVLKTGLLAAGIAPGDITITAVAPDLATTTSPAAAETGGKGGLYSFLVPSSFLVANGVGTYAVTMEVNSASPVLVDATSAPVRVNKGDFDTIIADLGLVAYLGAIWLDPNNGTAGTVVGENGLPTKPVTTLADAEALMDATGIRVLRVVTGLIELDRNFTETTIIGGAEVEIRLNGKSVNGSVIKTALVKGAMTGRVAMEQCDLEDVTGFAGTSWRCGLDGTTALAAGLSIFHEPYSRIPGLSTPIVDVGGTGRRFSLRGHNGGIEVRNVTGDSDVTLNMASGQFILATTCSGGTIVVSGDAKKTDNSTGSVTDFTGLNNPETITDAVWGRSTSDVILGGGVGEALIEMWRILGLDPAEPLTVSATERKSGTVITQTISEAAGVVTVTKV